MAGLSGSRPSLLRPCRPISLNLTEEATGIKVHRGRVLYLRSVLLFIGQFLASIGAFRDDLKDGDVVDVDWRLWSDGTTIGKKPTACVYAMFIFTAAVFASAFRRQVQDAHPVLFSCNTAETRAAYDLFLSLIGLQTQQPCP